MSILEPELRARLAAAVPEVVSTADSLAASSLRALVDERFVWSRLAELIDERDRATVRALSRTPADPIADIRDAVNALAFEALPRPVDVVTRVTSTGLFDPRGTPITTHASPNRATRRAAARARKA